MIKRILIRDDKEYTFYQKLKYTLFILLCVFISSVIFYLIFDLLNLTDPERLKAIKKDRPSIDLIMAFKTLIIAPIVEELIFREPLKKNKIMVYVLATYSLLFLGLKHNTISFAFSGYVLLLVVDLFYFKETTNALIVKITFTTVLFGFLHISNLNYQGLGFLPYYLYQISPIIMLGFGLALIRLKFNVYWSMIGHFIFNLITIIPILLKK